MKFGESYGKHPKRVQKGSSDLTKEALFMVSFPPRNRPKVSKKGYQIYPKWRFLSHFHTPKSPLFPVIRGELGGAAR